MRRIWEQEFTPAVFDLDARGEMLPSALCRYFGVAAGYHASELGVGDESLRPNGIAWMLNRLEIRFPAPAATMTPLCVETWPSDRSSRLRAERDFVIRQNGAVVAEGLSTWLLIQLSSRRPARMLAEVLSAAAGSKEPPFEPGEDPESGPFGGEVQWQIPAGWADLDINSHVSFPRLVEWTLNAAPPGHWARHRVRSMILRFEQEALPGESITARFGLLNGVGCHALEKDGRTAVRAWTTWESI